MPLLHQTKFVQLPDIFFSRGQEIDSGRLDTAVAQHIRQPHHIVTGAVKRPGKQAAQVVGIYLPPLHACCFAQCFHFGPDLLPIHSHTALGDEDLTRGDFLLSGIFLQLAAQAVRQQDGADLPLQRDLRHPGTDRLHRDVFHLADPDVW